MRRGGLFSPNPTVFTLLMGATVAGWSPAVFGQVPPAPNPAAISSSPAPPSGTDSPAQLAARLRKMEVMNQQLLQQFDGMAKQNAALAKQVQDLSKKLDDATNGTRTTQTAVVNTVSDVSGGRDVTAPYLSESAARPSRFPQDGTGGIDTGANVGAGVATGGGRDVTAPYLSESAARPSRGGLTGPATQPNRLALSSFYDQNRYGYVTETQNQEFELRFNALLQSDARMYNQGNQSPVVSDLNIPRMRVYFSGRMTKPFEYQISFQRSTNNLDLLNAYINVHYDDRFQIRFGRYKAPYTYEWYKMAIWEFSTPDRSLFALNFGPNRQVGLMGWGFLFKERLEYSVGIFDGPRNSYQDFNQAKDVMALLDYKPFYQTTSPFKNFGIGGSLDQGHENNPAVPALLRTSTSASGNTTTSSSGDNFIAVPFLAFNNNVRERGNRALWELHATYFYKRLALLGVWDGGINDFALTNPTAKPVHLPVGGYFAQASYMLTGETRERPSLVNPIHPFDIRHGKFGLGAWEVYARYSELDVGRQVFTGGLADPNLWTNRADMIDVGFNVYLNKFVKFYFDWEHAVFAQPVEFGNGMQKTSDLFWLRLQIYL